jgi:hypothetical protein
MFDSRLLFPKLDPQMGKERIVNVSHVDREVCIHFSGLVIFS